MAKPAQKKGWGVFSQISWARKCEKTPDPNAINLSRKCLSTNMLRRICQWTSGFPARAENVSSAEMPRFIAEAASRIGKPQAFSIDATDYYKMSYALS